MTVVPLPDVPERGLWQRRQDALMAWREHPDDASEDRLRAADWSWQVRFAPEAAAENHGVFCQALARHRTGTHA